MLSSTLFFFILSLLSGGLFPLAFAPHEIWPFAILSPAMLLWIWQRALLSPKQAFVTGLGYGLGMFGMGVSWVFVSIHEFGHTPILLAVFITFLLVTILSLFMAVQGYFLKRFFQGPPCTFWLLGFPSAWVLFEWLRSWLFTGFPWLYIGYALLGTPLSGYAPIAGVYGVSFAGALTSGSLLSVYQGKRAIKITAILLVAMIWGMGFWFAHFPFTTPEPEIYTVSLIQGNIKPLDKFTQEDPIGAVEKTYGALTEKEWGQDLILWPESAIPLPLPYSESYLHQLQHQASIHHSTLITGIQFINEKGEYHNSLIALGNGQGIYHKYHLLPFGDFVPLSHWLRGLIHFFDLPSSSFVEGPKNQDLITAGKLQLDPLICYEIAFPELVRETSRNADAIITLSEDGWFGRSWGPHQHLQIARMRARETGRYVLRATTSGITAIIHPKGAVVATIPPFQATTLKGTFHPMKGKTPWVQLGIWPLLLILIGCFILPRKWKHC